MIYGLLEVAGYCFILEKYSYLGNRIILMVGKCGKWIPNQLNNLYEVVNVK